ncbi:uncharacterized protein TNCV_1312521 [Trichonephila clavipes]|nr:uncharacterized protein TNCV_1312521 [Trichonephila clavipes]
MASKAKILKSIQHFDNVGKEIERFEKRIRDAIAEPDCSAALIDVLKSKIEKFSELNIDVGDEKWEKYLDMQDSLLNCSVSLEKVTHTFKKETGKENLENKNLVAKKMPKLELPQFHGEMEYWITFKELFQATVFDNSDLTEIDKLQYLFASVKGNAAELIRGFAIKKENLKNCWELLCERYENKNQLANCQINKLFSIRTNKANSAKQLFEILDNCNESVRDLTVLGLEINQLSELIIINHCTSKLHEEIAHRWELTLKPDTYPTLQAFRMFIESEARALGLLSGNADAPKSKFGTSNQIINKSYAESRKNVGFEKGSQFSQRNFNQPKKSLVFNANLDKNYSFSCAICKENASHPLYKCPVFNRMKVEERIKAIEGICCTNCLRKNHTTPECRINIGYKVCKDHHHTLLHVYNVNGSALSENSQNVVAVSRGCQLKGNKQNSPVLLSTAIIKIKSKSGKCIECRALIDNASQLSLISGRLKEKLDIPVKSEKQNFGNQRDLLEGMPIFEPAGTPTAIPTKLGYILSGKIYAPPLKESKEKAVQLLYALENKFHKNQQFKDNFLNFMNEYLALGHMREISQKRDDETPNCYIPYHMSFELQTITYGTSCAPFLALRTLQQLYQDEEQNFPLTAKIARENIYIDDLLSGADTEVEAKSIIIEIQNLLKSGGFILRKWSGSHQKVLQDLDASLLASKPIHSLGDEESKPRVLGLIWNLKTDSIQVKVVHEEIVKTKRQLLSVIAQIFDPLGLFSPSVITLKIMLQELRKSKAFWDDPIPSSILENWNKFTKESKYLNSISIPRFMGIDQNSDIILHGFCDASTKAYAAVFYLKPKQEIHLVSAKTRVAPIKQLTIPRLELCGALLLAELISVIQKALRTKPAECFLWTDSKIVLSFGL